MRSYLLTRCTASRLMMLARFPDVTTKFTKLGTKDTKGFASGETWLFSKFRWHRDDHSLFARYLESLTGRNEALIQK